MFEPMNDQLANRRPGPRQLGDSQSSRSVMSCALFSVYWCQQAAWNMCRHRRRHTLSALMKWSRQILQVTSSPSNRVGGGTASPTCSGSSGGSGGGGMSSSEPSLTGVLVAAWNCAQTLPPVVILPPPESARVVCRWSVICLLASALN